MVPEILGFLIIAGALLVLVVRYISQRRQGVDMEELRTSTEQLKAELTRSADAVIARMGNHIQHLEGLVRQADERNVRLEAGLNEYKRLTGEMEDRSATLQRELNEARKVIAELAAYQSVPLMPVPPANPPMNRERVDAQEFAAVLQNSMERQESEPAINAQQAAGLAEAMNRKPEEQEETISRSRKQRRNLQQSPHAKRSQYHQMLPRLRHCSEVVTPWKIQRGKPVWGAVPSSFCGK